MKKRFQPLWLLGALAFVLSVGLVLDAQQSSSQQGQSTGQQAQQPTPPPASQQSQPATPNDAGQEQPAAPPSAQSPNAPAGGTPEQAAPPSSAAPSTAPASPSTGTAAQPNSVQAFSGTIVREGDRYMLHDEATGQTYDLDHQTEVQKYAGKRVRVHGTLDPATKTIHLQ